jgi:hypothetical protein
MASQMSDAARALDQSQTAERDSEHQLDLIRSAVALLAAGGARRVTLIGLTLDSQSLREIGSHVRANGMAMRVMPGHVGSDVTVEASG